ncbi:hypothetical protein B0H14DRAFT_3511819 [Mycena olivaceomarginata]|nr:hypothetical protein B0H14DRAFT_3511819 [Mycena olivaceomarginata]
MYNAERHQLAYPDVSDIEPSPQTFEIILEIYTRPHTSYPGYGKKRMRNGKMWTRKSPRDHLHHSLALLPHSDAPSSRAPSPELESAAHLHCRHTALTVALPGSPFTKGGKKKRQQRARQKAAQAAVWPAT